MPKQQANFFYYSSWAEKGIRVLFDSLINAGFSSIISAPAENQSGRGSASEAPLQLNGGGCEFHSCPSKSPPTGHNKSRPEFNVGLLAHLVLTGLLDFAKRVAVREFIPSNGDELRNPSIC